MKNIFFPMILIASGLVLGAALLWIFFYASDSDEAISEHAIHRIVKYSNVEISADNFSCEGEHETTVGAVFSSIVSFNSTLKLNRLSYGCVNSVCSFSISNCKPWQSDSCGSRLLVFDITQDGAVKPESFRCIDMP